MILDEAVAWTELLEVVEAVSQPIRVSVDYVTTYRGEPVDSGQKSVTLTLTYRSASGTLRSEQVDEQVGRVVEALKEKLSASLRA